VDECTIFPLPLCGGQLNLFGQVWFCFVLKPSASNRNEGQRWFLEVEMAIRTWWLTGLPGAGKSTLASALATALRADGQQVCIIDGDDLRTHLSSDLGFSPQDRAENIRRAACVASMLNMQDMHAIVALISPIRACREQARQQIGADRFIEVHVATPVEVCAARDPKGLYAKARSDRSISLTGYSDGYEAPLFPQLSIDTSLVALPDAVRMLRQAAIQ
jgi:adenylylsulfate kinase